MPVKTTVTPTDIILAQLKNELLGQFATVHEELNAIQDNQTPPKPNLPNTHPAQQKSKSPAQLQQERLFEKRRVDTYKQLNKLFDELTAGLKKNNIELIKFYKYVKQNNVSLESLSNTQKASNLAFDEFLTKLKTENDLGEETKIDSEKVGQAIAKSFSDKLKASKSKESDKSAKTLEKIEKNTAPVKAKTKVEVVKEAEETPEETKSLLENFTNLSKLLLGNAQKAKEKEDEKKKSEKPKEEEKELTKLQKVSKIGKLLLGVPERKKEYDAESPVSNIGLIVDGIKNAISPKKEDKKDEKKDEKELQKSTYELLSAQFLQLQKIELAIQSQLGFEKLQAASLADDAEASEADKLAYQKQFLERMEALTTGENKASEETKKNENGTGLISKIGGFFDKLKDFGLLTLGLNQLKSLLSPLTKLGPMITTFIRSLGPLLISLVGALPLIAAGAAALAGIIAIAASTKKFGEMINAKRQEVQSEKNLKEQSKSEIEAFTSKMRELGKKEYEITEIENIKDEVQRKNKARTELTKTYIQQLREKYDVNQTKLDELSQIQDSQEQLRKVTQLFNEKQKAKLLTQDSKVKQVNQTVVEKTKVLEIQEPKSPKVEQINQSAPAKIESIPQRSEKLIKSEEKPVEEKTNKTQDIFNSLREENSIHNRAMQNYTQEMIAAIRESKTQLRTEYIIPPQNVPSLLMPVLSIG